MRDRTRAAAARAMVPALAGAVMLCLGAWDLGRASLDSSESATRWAASLDMHDFVRLIGHVDAVHALYYLLMHVWLLFGSGLVWLRLPSLIGMTAAVVLVTVVARRLSGSEGVSLVAGLLTAASPFVNEYAQYARSYAIVCAAVWLTTLVLLGAVRADRGRWWVGYAALVAVTGYLHELSLLVLIAHGVTVLLARPPRRILIRWLVAAASGATAVVPLVVVSARESQAVAWIGPISGRDTVQLLHSFFGSSTPIAITLGALALIGAVPLARPRPGTLTVQLVTVPLLLLPPGVLMLESAIGKPLWSDRYVLYSLPAGLILAAVGLARVVRLAAVAVRGAERTRAALALSAAAALCVAVVAVQLPDLRLMRTPQGRPQDYAAALQILDTGADSDDGLLFMSRNFRNIELGYPGVFHGFDDLAQLQSPRTSGTFRGTDAPLPVVLARTKAAQRIWVVGDFGRATASARDRALRSVLRRTFVLDLVRRYRGIRIDLFTRRGAPNPQAGLPTEAVG